MARFFKISQILSGIKILLKSPVHSATPPSVGISHGQTLLIFPYVSQGNLDNKFQFIETW